MSAPPPSYDELEREKLNPTEPSAPPPTQQGSPGIGYTSQQPNSGYPPQQQGQYGVPSPGQYGQPPPGQYGQPPPGQYGQPAPIQYPQPQFQHPITAGGQPYVQNPTTVIYAGRGAPPGNSVVYMPNGQTAQFNAFGAPMDANAANVRRRMVIGLIVFSGVLVLIVLIVTVAIVV